MALCSEIDSVLRPAMEPSIGADGALLAASAGAFQRSRACKAARGVCLAAARALKPPESVASGL